MTSRETEGISVAQGTAGRGTLVSARVGCFIASISNIILHTRFINNINSGIPLKRIRFWG